MSMCSRLRATRQVDFASPDTASSFSLMSIGLRASATIPAFKSTSLLLGLSGVVREMTNVVLTATTSTSQLRRV